MAGPKSREQAEVEIGQLPGLSHHQLKDRWKALFHNPAPKHISRQLLLKAVAYGIRDQAGFGLSSETKRRLRQIAAAIRDGREDTLYIGPCIKPGTRLVRAWRGESQIVDVLSDGFEWQGKRYRSLSAIAKAISGTNWNGYVFFGVKRRPAHNKNAAGSRRLKDQSAIGTRKLASDGPSGQASVPYA